MPLYRWNTDNLEPVSSTTFEAEQLQERADLQRVLRDQPDVLEEGLFIVAEEFGNWEDSSRRIDLLALDRGGRLVVIELKRTESGEHMDLQAIRYAAMVANITQAKLSDAHRDYLSSRGIDEEAEEQVQEHLSNTETHELDTQRPRIILVSAGFSKELTTSVLWLNDNGLDIVCIRLKLYRNSDVILIDTEQIIPLPETADYLVKVREKEVEERKQRQEGKSMMGAQAFEEAIYYVPAESQASLLRLHQWAIALEREGLCSLITYFSTGTKEGEVTLLTRIPPEKAGLVTIYNERGSARLQFFRSVFQRRAPNSMARIEQLTRLGQGNKTGEIPDSLLDALTEAYREANGKLVPTTPPLYTAPDSPPPADC